jgi:hypothetical protein
MSDDEGNHAYDDDDQEGFDLEYSTKSENRKQHTKNQFVSNLKANIRMVRRRGRQSLQQKMSAKYTSYGTMRYQHYHME